MNRTMRKIRSELVLIFQIKISYMFRLCFLYYEKFKILHAEYAEFNNNNVPVNCSFAGTRPMAI